MCIVVLSIVNGEFGGFGQQIVTPLINHPRIQHLYSKGQHYCGKITFNVTIHDNINGIIGVQYTVFSFIPLQQAHCQRNTIEQIFWA